MDKPLKTTARDYACDPLNSSIAAIQMTVVRLREIPQGGVVGVFFMTPET
jgi:hypothetical protein